MKDERVWARVVALFVGMGLVTGAIGYPVTAIVLRNRQQVKKAAAEINALVAPNETLYAVNPDYQPSLFLRESAGAIREPRERSATQRALLSRSK